MGPFMHFKTERGDMAQSEILKESSSQLKTRILSASVLLTALFLILAFGDFIGVQVLILIVSGICFYEYFNMLFKKDNHLYFKWLGATLGMFVTFVHVSGHHQYILASISLVLLVFFFFYLYHAENNQKELVQNMALSLWGVFYISFLLGFFPLMRPLENGQKWILLVLLLSWGSDLGGYWGGRLFGTRKLYPSVSPNKTMEGAFSAILFATSMSVIFALSFFKSLDLVEALFLGVVGSVLAQIGDLCESLLKRSFDVKDSGNLIPGHGGMLDCIDSVLFVGPFIYLYIQLVK